MTSFNLNAYLLFYVTANNFIRGHEIVQTQRNLCFIRYFMKINYDNQFMSQTL